MPSLVTTTLVNASGYKIPISLTLHNHNLNYSGITDLSDYREHPWLSIITTIDSYTEVNFLRMCITIKSFHYSKYYIRRTFFNMTPPRATF